MTLTALVVDDESLLRQELCRELRVNMHELDTIAEADSGNSAIAWLKENTADIVFMDIRMPGISGLELARWILDDYSRSTNIDAAVPLLVFVTAYDEYAVQAFESEAVDYLLKPINAKRLNLSLTRIRERLQLRESIIYQNKLESKLNSALSQLTEQQKKDKPLGSIQASVGDQIRLIPTNEIILFQAEDKYVSIYTTSQQALIREPLRDLLPRLNSELFVQIHRSTIVNLSFVEAAERTKTGSLKLRLRESDLQPTVSRTHRHLFKAM